MKEDKIIYYVGSKNNLGKTLKIFDEEVCNFLNDLSLSLMHDKHAKAYADIITFAFYIRKSNIQNKKMSYESDFIRLGKGISFHIAPSNVPINFAFSLVFGLLSGNINIVKVSQKKFSQVEIVCNHINKILSSNKYPNVKENITVISYEHDKEITDYYSLICDIRVIWGGDNTINEIRKSPISPRTTEITFADRYSFSILSAEGVADIDDNEMKILANNFYNDTYLMDQNACSSPHLIAWLDDVEGDENKLNSAKSKFWRYVFDVAKKWNIDYIHASEKYTSACLYASKYDEILNLQKYDNTLYVMNLSSITDNSINIRGKLGLFSQVSFKSYDELLPLLKKETQTITYFAIDAKKFAEYISASGVAGVDRIVPLGKSLELDLIWDGVDVINTMSRLIFVS